MKRFRLLLPVILLTGTLVAAGLLAAPVFLSPREAQPGGVAVVEGWMIPELIEVAAAHLKQGDYRQVVVTGGASDHRPFGMYLNGVVRIFPDTGLQAHSPLQFQTSSSACNGMYARFEVWLGKDMLLDTVSAGFTEAWSIPLENGWPQGVPLEFRFFNDEARGDEDRNLWVDSVLVNGEAWHLWAKKAVFEYSYEGQIQQEVRYPNDAARGANLLVYYGIPASKIYTCTSFETSSGGRTAAEAAAFAAWDKQCGTQSDSYELLSSNYHARRSFRLFRKSLGKNTSWGIWSIGEGLPSSQDWLDHAKRGEVMRQLAKWIVAGLFYHPELSTSQTEEPTSCVPIVPDEGVTPFGLTGFP